MKKHLCAILSLFVLVLLMTACSAKTVASGKCGEYLTWTLDDRGKLTISATRRGAKMDDYTLSTSEYSTPKLPPWAIYRESVTSIAIKGNVEYIGQYAFAELYTAMKKVTISKGTTYIGDRAFFNCTALEEVSLPNSLVSLGESVFGGCTSLESIAIPKNVTNLSPATFFECAALKNVELPDSMTIVGDAAFMKCTSLESITLPKNLLTIDQFAFSDCSSLGSITIPESTTTIGEMAFYGCSSLKSMYIPGNTTALAFSALYDCNALQDIYYGGTIEQWRALDIDFAGALSKVTIRTLR